jgi:hypothetical protein
MLKPLLKVISDGCLFDIQGLKMTAEKFGPTIISFLGILIFFISVCTNCDAYAQTEVNQSGISSPWTSGAPLPTPRSEIAGAALNGKI